MRNALAPTALALLGFAGNSIICRLALESESIDASSFTVIRLLSGALALAVILVLKEGNLHKLAKGSWSSALMLFVYACAFSFAYHYLGAGMGALILFGAVQVTMLLVDYARGNRLSLWQWSGLACAISGFILLMLPSIQTPSVPGALLMLMAGCAWGMYTINGKGSRESLADTAGNFIRSLPFALLLVIAARPYLESSPYGIVLAVISGSLTTGVVYVIWYFALNKLSIVQSAIVQLLVPVIAALGGVIFLNEMITGRFVFAAMMILGGILAVFIGRDNFHPAAR